MSETVIYISKRCPHCRKLLMKIQQRQRYKRNNTHFLY